MDDKSIQLQLERSRAELLMLYEVGNAMMTTLRLDEILYIILTAVTVHDGLGFNRAMLFLVNEKEGVLEGKMSIGPDTGDEANKIWRQIETEQMTLDDLIASYKLRANKPDSQLNKMVKGVRIPLKEESGILALCVLEGMPFEVSAQTAGARLSGEFYSTLSLAEFAVVPLKSKDKVLGAIVVDNLYTKEPITKDDLRVLMMFANQAGLAIENAQLYEQTVLLSNSDSLTRLWNHGYFQYLLSEEIKRAQERKQSFALIMIDIDNFKTYNDALGHQAGDQLLKELAKVLRKTARERDVIARYGGEEFAIILPEVTLEKARVFAERLRAAVETHKFPHDAILPAKKLTVSIGLSMFPEDAQDKETLIKCSDRALYDAKYGGKNKVSDCRR